MTIESPSLCEIINGPMDEYGMFNIKPFYEIENEKNGAQFLSQIDDITEQYSEENISNEDTTPPAEQVTEISDDKKKIGKIEL